MLNENALLGDVELDNGRPLSRTLKLEKEGDVIVSFGQRAPLHNDIACGEVHLRLDYLS